MVTSSLVPCPQGRKYGCSTLVMVSEFSSIPVKVPSRVQAKELRHGTATLVTGIPISITGKQRSGLAYKNGSVYTAVSSFRDNFSPVPRYRAAKPIRWRPGYIRQGHVPLNTRQNSTHAYCLRMRISIVRAGNLISPRNVKTDKTPYVGLSGYC